MNATIEPQNIYTIKIGSKTCARFRLESHWNGMARFVNVDPTGEQLIVYDTEGKLVPPAPFEATVIVATKTLLETCDASVAGAGDAAVVVETKSAGEINV